MNFPEELLYTRDHEWVKVDGGIATVGITDFAQGELGDIVYVDIETLNQTVEHGAIFGTVEAVKTVSELYMPVTGTVIEVNSELAGAPESVNHDPYGKGWMIRVQLTNGIEGADLLSAADYRTMIGA